MDKAICKGCNKLTYLSSKIKQLCADCVYKRNHGGKSKAEVMIEKRNKKNIPTHKKINAISPKQRIIKNSLKNTYHQIDKERELICAGCGKRQGGNIILSHSHIISQKDCKNIRREDLIFDEKNIALHCMTFAGNFGCHNKWENPALRSALLDYESNIQYIKSISEELYHKYSV